MSTSAIQNISHNKFFNWLVRNLFSSWVNTLLTIIALIFIYQVGSFCLNWAIFEADFRYNFQGELITDRGLCSKNIMPGEYGACWAIIYARWDQFMYGLYPIEEAWRVNLIYALLPLAIIGILFDKIPFRKYFIYFTFIYPFLAYFMLYGGPGLTVVGTNKWGGLLVTLFFRGHWYWPGLSFEHPFGSRKKIENANYQISLCCLHRIHSRRTFNYFAFYRKCHVALISP